MDVAERIALPAVAAPGAGEEDMASAEGVVYSHAGVALPRMARPRTGRGPRERGGAMIGRYSVRSFTIRSPEAASLLEEVYHLRARVFMRELGWLAESGDGRERDRCDAHARHFAIFAHPVDGGRPALAGYARALLPRHTFMLQREFVELLGGEAFNPNARRAFEVSRFVIEPALRGLRCAEGHTITERLARAIGHWALACGRDQWYTVCETRYLRALRLRGVEFTPFGQPVAYQPGVEARAATLRLSAAAATLRARRPRDYAWYMRSCSDCLVRWPAR